jgi:hypothetical protein
MLNATQRIFEFKVWFANPPWQRNPPKNTNKREETLGRVSLAAT